MMKLAYVGKHKNLKVGVEFDYSIEDSQSKNIQAVVEYIPPSESWLKWVKAKIDTHWELSLAGEVSLGERFKIKSSLYWFNFFKQSLPSQFSLRATYN